MELGAYRGRLGQKARGTDREYRKGQNDNRPWSRHHLHGTLPPDVSAGLRIGHPDSWDLETDYTSNSGSRPHHWQASRAESHKLACSTVLARAVRRCRAGGGKDHRLRGADNSGSAWRPTDLPAHRLHFGCGGTCPTEQARQLLLQRGEPQARIRAFRAQGRHLAIRAGASRRGLGAQRCGLRVVPGANLRGFRSQRRDLRVLLSAQFRGSLPAAPAQP